MHVPPTLQVVFEIPKLKKMLKVTVSSRNSIKNHVPLFANKLDSDFGHLSFTAFTKKDKRKQEFPIDVPFRFISPQQLTGETLVIEIELNYEGG
jgi:hypothetical protein